MRRTLLLLSGNRHGLRLLLHTSNFNITDYRRRERRTLVSFDWSDYSDPFALLEEQITSPFHAHSSSHILLSEGQLNWQRLIAYLNEYLFPVHSAGVNNLRGKKAELGSFILACVFLPSLHRARARASEGANRGVVVVVLGNHYPWTRGCRSLDNYGKRKR